MGLLNYLGLIVHSIRNAPWINSAPSVKNTPEPRFEPGGPGGGGLGERLNTTAGLCQPPEQLHLWSWPGSKPGRLCDRRVLNPLRGPTRIKSSEHR